MLRKVMSAVVTAILASIGLVTVTSAPALAADNCRTTYTVGQWNAYPCVYREIVAGEYQYYASAHLTSYPSNCSTFRAILTFPDGTNYISTGAWACSKHHIWTVNAAFPGQTATGAKGKLVAYNSSGSPILTLLSPTVY
jgi:hypothetical protein